MTQNSSSSEENAILLREFALRLLAPLFDPEAQQPQLLVGQLPSALPFELPLPDGCRIIGTFIRSPETMQIVLDTDQLPAQIIAFYTERMQASGWSEPDFSRRHRQHEGGFVHTMHDSLVSTTLCKGKHGPALFISTSRGQDEDERTEVRLHLDTRSRNSPCGQSSEIFIGVGRLIPALEPPSGGRQWGGGGGGSDSDSASTSATLDMQSDMTFPLLAAHYAQQLEQAGWQRTGEGSSGPMAWHTWKFSDEENERWLGVFTLLEIPGIVRKYYLQIHINWVGNKG